MTGPEIEMRIKICHLCKILFQISQSTKNIFRDCFVALLRSLKTVSWLLGFPDQWSPLWSSPRWLDQLVSWWCPIYGLHQGDMVTKNGETPSGHHEGGMITCSPGDSPFGHQSRWNDQDPATSWTPALDCACHPSCKIQGQKYFTFTLFTAPPRKAKRVQRCCQLPFYIT